MKLLNDFLSRKPLAAALMFFAFLSVPVTVFAADTTARQVINAGALSISAPALETFSSVTVSLTAQVQTLTFSGDVTVTDLRGSSSTFTAQVVATEFTDGGTETMLTSALEYKSDAPSTTTTSDLTSITYTSAFTAFDGASPSAAQTVMSKNNSDKVGSWDVTPSLRLTIPAKKKAGTYNSTITFSVS